MPEGLPDSAALLAPLAIWFERERRTLPWRAPDLDAPHPDPYAVLVSELMLQQTQVATVVPYFQRWMAALPTIRDLSGAPDDQIHKLWEGLGYYRRARLLQAAGRAIQTQGWPATLEGLLDLPGLGPYTAAALASIAFQLPEPALDGNAFRVLARLLKIESDPRPLAPGLREWLRPALAAHGPSRMTQAIMELGATWCGRRARCGACPLNGACRARAAGLEDRIPSPIPRAQVRSLELTLVALRAGDRFLVVKPGATGLLAGLWGWPCLEGAASSGDRAAEARAAFRALEATTAKGWIQVYTHRREQITPVLATLPVPFPPGEGRAWVTAAELAALPMGRRDQRLRELALKG